MKPTGRKRIFSDELSALRLRSADKGRIQGEFEHHFFGAHENTRNPFFTSEFGYGLWSRWYTSAKKIFEIEKLEPEQPSETLNHFFEAFFKVELPRGVRLTPELCHSWNDKHIGFLTEIWRQRKRD